MNMHVPLPLPYPCSCGCTRFQLATTGAASLGHPVLPALIVDVRHEETGVEVQWQCTACGRQYVARMMPQPDIVHDDASAVLARRLAHGLRREPEES